MFYNNNKKNIKNVDQIGTPGERDTFSKSDFKKIYIVHQLIRCFSSAIIILSQHFNGFKCLSLISLKTFCCSCCC